MTRDGPRLLEPTLGSVFYLLRVYENHIASYPMRQADRDYKGQGYIKLK